MNPATNSSSANLILKFLKISGISFIILLFSLNAAAQMKDTSLAKLEKDYKNSIKVNLTSWLLYANGLQMSYERVLSPKRSISVFGGIISFPMPTLISNSNITFDQDKTKSGFSIGAEYRFYLAKENKYAAPRGVYLAPFISYYHFNNQRSGHDSTNTDNLTLNSTINFFNVGGELGYQFVIKKRFVVDCIIFGPALSSYSFNIKLDGVTTGDQQEKIDAIIAALKDKFPLLKDATKGAGISKSGVSTSWSAGFRYVIQIGYHF
jgi:hypothetical protein